MRRSVLVVLAFVLLAMVPPSVPAASVERCAPSCTVLTVDNAFVPPVTVVESGATLTWAPAPLARNPHTSTAVGDAPCFNAFYGAGSTARATLTLVDGQLLARTGNGADKPCLDALMMPGGAARLSYVCLLHPSTMVGELVVLPGSA